MPRPYALEAKVALPALIMGPAIIIVPALYGLAKVYGFEPTSAQNMAWIGLGVALQYVAHVYLGYRAPHTPRPELVVPEQDFSLLPEDEPQDVGSRRISVARAVSVGHSPSTDPANPEH